MTPTRSFRRYVRVRMTHYGSSARCFEKVESRVFCRCELCCMRFGRMLYPERGGHPIRFRRISGFAGNFRLRQRIRAASAKVGERVAMSAEARSFYDDWGTPNAVAEAARQSRLIAEATSEEELSFLDRLAEDVVP